MVLTTKIINSFWHEGRWGLAKFLGLSVSLLAEEWSAGASPLTQRTEELSFICFKYMPFLFTLRKKLYIYIWNHWIYRADDLYIGRFQSEEKVKVALCECGYRIDAPAGCLCSLPDPGSSRSNAEEHGLGENTWKLVPISFLCLG